MTTIQATSTKLLTGKQAPALEVQTLKGQQWQLSEQKPQNYSLILFYRGLHCPFCKAQLQDLDQKLNDIAQLGMNAIAISGDSLERATKSQQEWNVQNVTIGYGLSAESMRRWGLYISKGAFENEPPLFNEPAIFLVRPDGNVQLAIINSTPFGRPHLNELLSGIDYILKNNYPVRGTEV